MKPTTRKVARTATLTFKLWSKNCRSCLCPTPEIPETELETFDLPEEREDGAHVFPFQHWWPHGWVEVKHGTEDTEHFCEKCWTDLVK